MLGLLRFWGGFAGSRILLSVPASLVFGRDLLPWFLEEMSFLGFLEEISFLGSLGERDFLRRKNFPPLLYSRRVPILGIFSSLAEGKVGWVGIYNPPGVGVSVCAC